MRERMSAFLIFGLCAAVLFSSAGCEPLRKKFTRQKKKSAVDDSVIPVLEPVEYPVKQHGAKEEYAQHYSLFRVWFSDFDTNRNNTSNEKKLIFNLDSALKELGEMEMVLKSPAKEELAKIKAQVEFIRKEYDKPKAFRNQARIDSEVRSIDRAMRKSFKPDTITF
jgi:hypothetical protein